MLFFSCSKYVHNDIRIYVDRFEKECMLTVTIPIYLDPFMSKDYFGACYYLGSHIHLNESSWNKMDDTEREMLVFHELGHCELRKKNTKGRSIMNIRPLSNKEDYIKNRGKYIKELCNGNR